MKPPPFDYHAPKSVEEACALLTTLEGAKVLAGGQSLVAMLNARFLYPDHLVDINRIPGLDGIAVGAGKLAIGATARQHRVEVDPLVARNVPILAEALPMVGHRQTRNRGTIGGSLCHLDPAAELPLVALASDAEVRTVGAGGATRVIAIERFIGGYMSPAIDAGELVVGIDFPLWPADHGYAFVERARRHGDFALAAAACLMTLGADGRVARVALAVNGLGPVPVRLAGAEADVLGSTADRATLERAAERCAALEAFGDVHASAAYRRSIAGALVRRALATAYGRARERGDRG